ncbi:type II signal peptidase [Aureibacillus halotolerans]|uniref:Type II signal peptidase n=1 Tax=Aureibacillus halotolerans TaxID=1508390 RepID=A0A4R6TPM7_9BACI|nr:type II signal peptidase [Aureibacillus halotolerans]
MADIALHPFTVQDVTRRKNEVPSNIQSIGAPDWWKQGFTGKGVVVAVFDTGCDARHPDLQEAIIGGRNFTNDDGGRPHRFDDYHGHGTHVTGIIAARKNNTGVVGVAPDARILVVKVLDKDGNGTYEQLTRGIQYALDWRGSRGERVRVLSMSLAGPKDDSALKEAIEKASEANALVVCAAGNSGDGRSNTSEVGYPGFYSECVQVGAIDQKRSMAPFSNSNDEIDLVAPGVDILSTYPRGSYATLSGTSMAAPHVSGAAALLIQKYELGLRRSIIEAEVFALLVKHTEALGFDPREEGYGSLLLGKGKAFPKAQGKPKKAKASQSIGTGSGFVVTAAAIGEAADDELSVRDS